MAQRFFSLILFCGADSDSEPSNAYKLLIYSIVSYFFPPLFVFLQNKLSTMDAWIFIDSVVRNHNFEPGLYVSQFWFLHLLVKDHNFVVESRVLIDSIFLSANWVGLWQPFPPLSRSFVSNQKLVEQSQCST